MTKKSTRGSSPEKENVHDQAETSEKAGKTEPVNGREAEEKETAAEPGEEASAQPSLELQLSEWKDKYLRLSADFDNYRKRTLREKMDLAKTAGEGILLEIIHVMDDFDRAMQQIRDARDIEAVKTGIGLIYQKMNDFIRQHGVKEIESFHKEFNTDFHEAVTKLPVHEKKLKGKVVDVVQKGYTLHDKVIRYSRVVVGE